MGERTNDNCTAKLREFRRDLYALMSRRADALFEICDAILSVSSVPSPPHLSLSPIHRWGWGSLYAALSQGSLDEEALRDLLADHPLNDDRDDDHAAVYVVDRSVWPRCDAEASPERGYYHYPSLHSAGQPIVTGWEYQLVAELGFRRDSWVAPMNARRVHPEEDANDIAAGQVEGLVRRLPGRSVDPLFVFDAGYDPVKLQT